MKEEKIEALQSEIQMLKLPLGSQRYAQIQQLVSRLTDDDALRTFFTLYLAAGSDDARNALERRFWEEVGALSPSEQIIFKAEFTRCFLKLPALAGDLLERVQPVSI